MRADLLNVSFYAVVTGFALLVTGMILHERRLRLPAQVLVFAGAAANAAGSFMGGDTASGCVMAAIVVAATCAILRTWYRETRARRV